MRKKKQTKITLPEGFPQRLEAEAERRGKPKATIISEILLLVQRGDLQDKKGRNYFDI